MRALKLITLLVLICGPSVSYGTTTKIGNGDDGSDLEGFQMVTSGPWIEARNAGIKKLKALNVPAIRGLSALIPELERSPIYVSEKDVGVKLEEDEAKFHSNISGQVYARTFAEPHAATRIFPVASTLTADQQVTLLVHEALHRALNEEVREDEEIVSAITMAITGPDASRDRIQRVAAKYIDEDETEVYQKSAAAKSLSAQIAPVRPDAQVRRTATMEYTYQSFRKSEEERYLEVSAMHSLKSQILAFGSAENPFGVGIQFGFIQWQNQSKMGPVGLSGDLKLWTVRGFDVLLTGQANFNSLANEEFKNSSFGRDVYSLGLVLRRDTDRFYLQNSLLYSMKGDVSQKIESMNYNHQYGGQGQFNVKGGMKLAGLRLGGFANVILSDYYRIYENPGNTLFFDSGRFHVMSAGPEIGFQSENFQANVFARWILSSSGGSDYNYIGNLLGEGAGSGMVGMSIGVSL